MAGLGGVIFAARLNSVDLNAGGGTLLLDAISAAVIGGTSLFGGRGRVISALIGALVISTVANGIDLLGYSSAIKYMVTGAILLAAVTLDTVSRRRLERRAGRGAREDEPRHLGARPDGDALRPGRLPARARGRDDARSGCGARSRGSEGLIDDYEFHYPGELRPDNLDEVREALDGHGIYTICTGLHLDPRFGRGGLVVARPRGARRGAAADARDRGASPATVGAQMVCWPGIEGYNYPFQTPYAESWAWFVDGDRARRPRSARSTGASSSSSTRTPSRR